MGDQVPEEVKRDRIERLIEVVQQVAHERNQVRIGRAEEVLVEGPSRTDPALLRGRTRRNTTVNFRRHGVAGSSCTSRSTPRRPRRSRAPSSQQLPRSRSGLGRAAERPRPRRPSDRGRRRDTLGLGRTRGQRPPADGRGLAGGRRLRRAHDRRSASDEELAEDPPAEKPVEAVHVSFFDSRPEVFEEVEQAAEAADHAAATRESISSSSSTFGRTSPPRSGRLRTHPTEASSSTATAAATAPTRERVPPAPRRRSDRGDRDRLLAQRGAAPHPHEEWFAQAADEAELERLHRISKTPASSMVQVLEELERRRQHRRLPEGRRSDGRGARAAPVPPVTEPRVLAVFGPTARGSPASPRQSPTASPRP